MSSELTPVLSAEEKSRKSKLERSIRNGMDKFLEVGMALLAIREEKLFREDYATFDLYCKTEWEFSRATANRLILEAEVLSSLSVTSAGSNLSHTETSEVGNTLPNRQDQLLSLAILPNGKRKQVWDEAVASAPAGKITARHVKAIVRKHVPKKRNPKAELDSAHKRGLILNAPYCQLKEMPPDRIGKFLDLTKSGVAVVDALKRVRNLDAPQEKPSDPEPAPPPADDVGLPLSGKMVEVFAAREQFQELLTVFKNAQASLHALATGPGGDLLRSPLHTELVSKGEAGKEKWRSAGVQEALDHLKALAPFASVCPWCHHEHPGKFARDCKACFGRGWVRKTDWEQPPQDYRDAVLASGKKG